MKATFTIDIPNIKSSGFITISVDKDFDHISTEKIDTLLVHICNKMNVDRIVTDDYNDGEIIDNLRVWKVGVAPKL